MAARAGEGRADCAQRLRSSWAAAAGAVAGAAAGRDPRAAGREGRRAGGDWGQESGWRGPWREAARRKDEAVSGRRDGVSLLLLWILGTKAQAQG